MTKTLSKTSQEVTLSISMRDRNYQLQIYLFTSNAKRFWKLYNGKITIMILKHIQKYSATLLLGLQPGVNQKAYVPCSYNVTHDGKLAITILFHIPKYSATVLHGLQPG